ncbi:MAG: hypothetical protein IJR87_02150 [Bacteroidaceae bacterium]|nr:hypothetical protein [Bacteroidaceae bacterium]
MVRVNINKHAGCLVMSLALLFASCKNDVVEITRGDAHINILLNNVLSPFTAYTQGDMDMYAYNGISSKIVVRVFVYDDSGHLTNSLSKEIADYKQSSLSLSTPIKGSNPLIVCLTYAVYTDSQGKKYNAYKVSGEELQSTLKIERDYASSSDLIPWQVLGGEIKTVGIDSEKNDIEVKPLGGLVYFDWNNIHAHDDESNAPHRYVFMNKYNDVITIKDGVFSYNSSLASLYYFYSDIYPSKFPSYNWIYDVCFIFPSNVEFYGYGGYSPSNYKLDDDELTTMKSSTKNIQIKAGKQYVFKMNCKDYTVDAYEGTLSD